MTGSEMTTLAPGGLSARMPRERRAPQPPPVPQVLSARLRAALRRDRQASGQRVPPNVRLPTTPTEGKPLPPPPPLVATARAHSARILRSTARAVEGVQA